MYIFLLCLCVFLLTYNYFSIACFLLYSVFKVRTSPLSRKKQVGSPLRLAAYWEQKSHQERWSAQYRRSREGVKQLL